MKSVQEAQTIRLREKGRMKGMGLDWTRDSKRFVEDMKDRKGDQRGVNWSQLKIIASECSAYDTKCAPNPGFLGGVWDSN